MGFDAIAAAEGLTDTAPEAAARRLASLRAMTPTHRLRLAAELSEAGRRLSKAGLRRQFPNLTETELKFAFIELVYGSEVAAMCRRAAEQRP